MKIYQKIEKVKSEAKNKEKTENSKMFKKKLSNYDKHQLIKKNKKHLRYKKYKESLRK